MKNLLFALSFGVMGVLWSADIPWKFEGDTNRVAAATAESTVWRDFMAAEVCCGASATWEGLVRSEYGFSYSSLVAIFTEMGTTLFFK